MKKKKARAASLGIIENIVSAMLREILVYIVQRTIREVNFMSLSDITDSIWLVIAVLVLVQFVAGIIKNLKINKRKKKKKRKK